MRRNPALIAILLIIAAAALWFSGKAVYYQFKYHQLDASAPATITKWSVNPISEDQFQIVATYHFPVGNNVVDGETAFKPYLRNPYTAEQYVKENSRLHWKAWYNSANSHDSTLQKKFPLKECLYAAILWGIFIYFVWLGNYVAKQH